MNVELIYDADCPNVAQARSLLIKAFTRTGVSARWREWERSAPECPEYARQYGSPTLLIDGKDVSGSAPGTDTRACRVYVDDQGRLGRTPSLDIICRALMSTAPGSVSRTRWHAVAASLPAVGTAMLPKLTCPLCFPAYAAVLGALGLEFFDYTPYLLPLTTACLAVALVVLAVQSRRTSNRYPLFLGTAASAIVLGGKFQFEFDWLTLGGIAALVTAVFLGSRIKSGSAASCPACVADAGTQQIQTH